MGGHARYVPSDQVKCRNSHQDEHGDGDKDGDHDGQGPIDSPFVHSG
jgi:hypothetical protein